MHRHLRLFRMSTKGSEDAIELLQNMIFDHSFVVRKESYIEELIRAEKRPGAYQEICSRSFFYTFALTTASTSRFHSYLEDTSRSVYCFFR